MKPIMISQDRLGTNTRENDSCFFTQSSSVWATTISQDRLGTNEDGERYEFPHPEQQRVIERVGLQGQRAFVLHVDAPVVAAVAIIRSQPCTKRSKPPVFSQLFLCLRCVPILSLTLDPFGSGIQGHFRSNIADYVRRTHRIPSLSWQKIGFLAKTGVSRTDERRHRRRHRPCARKRPRFPQPFPMSTFIPSLSW